MQTCCIAATDIKSLQKHSIPVKWYQAVMEAEEVDQHYMNPSNYYVTSYCSWHGDQFIRWVMWEITYTPISG